MRSLFALTALASLPLAALACGSDATGDPQPPTTNEPPEPTCGEGVAAKRFPGGDPNGHMDPFGAKAAGQARAGRLRDLSGVKRPDDARNRLVDADFVLANDKIAVFIEGARASDGYNPFGGEINAIEVVGADGRPAGVSQYGEMLLALSRQVVAPETVTVLADGSDGKAAVVRSSGVLKNIPFLETFRGLLPDEYNFPAALDYVLEPGASKVKLRLSFMNTRPEEVLFNGKQMFGFFHSNRSSLFTESGGYGVPKGKHPWVGYDGERTSFAIAQPGKELEFALEVSGFQYFQGSGLTVEACKTVETDYAEVIGGGPELDGLLQAVQAANGGPARREVKGTVESDDGAKLGGAAVVVTGQDGRVLSRGHADKEGAFSLRLPPQAATAYAVVPGYPTSPAVTLAADATTAKLVLAKGATLNIVAKEAGTNEPLPVRVQILPQTAVAKAPAEWGLVQEPGGVLLQEFPADGVARVVVPPGSHRVVVSRGFDYELFDQVVTAEAGKVTEVPVTLLRSVDTTGVMCADFHIHSNFSADSDDTVPMKVRAAVGEGLELPISSEHEWIIDFKPVIAKLGLSKWASSFPSEELTTFAYGHFGVIPLNPIPGAQNGGAVDWIGKSPPDIFKLVHERPEKPALIVNHPNYPGFRGYFSAAVYDYATAKGRDGVWSEEFEALEVFNSSDFDRNRDASVKSWFSMLNAGKTTWAVGSSDSHHWRSSRIGYPRTCMNFGHDDPNKVTPESVRDFIKTGAAIISGGLSMTVQGPGGAGPGGTDKAGAYKVTVSAASWVDATELEVLVDGETAKKLPLGASVGPGPGKRFDLTVDVAPTASRARHYVVFVAKGGRDLAPVSAGDKPFAVSNPIFF
ncbi:MAG TPA: CehA/McbA family metallohydrolase [Polyangiaceae bacterium]|nr:CehA/McbA family metallohydrolase [Polyangiaceae bacterium]